MPSKYQFFAVYMGPHELGIKDRMRKLSQISGVSMNKLLLLCVLACLPTLEKEVPEKRTFMLNGKKVVL
jgi:hypothetical protein